MSLTDRLFGRKGGAPRLVLGELQTLLNAAVVRRAGCAVVAALQFARLADRCRDAGVTPLLPEEFDALTRRLDGEAWGRLALLIECLELKRLRDALPILVSVRSLSELVKNAFTELARQTPLLTLELLRQSPLRVEELARRFVAELGATIDGETPQVSQQRLARLDYGQVLAEAERAKEAAAERVEQLRRLQQERESRRPRRGKW